MSEQSGVQDNIGPDFFGFYRTEVANLLSPDENLWRNTSHYSEDLHGGSRNSCTQKGNGISCSAPLFSNGIGALLPELKSERLKILLRQSVFNLTQEVDETVLPIRSLCQIRSCLTYKESLPSRDAAASKVVQSEHVNKKQRVLPSSSNSEGERNACFPARGPSNNAVKKCTLCHATETPQWRPALDGTKSLCNACGLRLRKQKRNGLNLSSNADTDKNVVEIDGDLQFILENDSTKVEEVMKKQSGELLAKLEHMEQSLEKLLNLTMDSCRPMTLNEKQQLRKLIEKLSGENLARVVEIIDHDKQPDSSEVYVDLDEEDKVTLWRLYFFITSVETKPPENTSIKKEA